MTSVFPYQQVVPYGFLRDFLFSKSQNQSGTTLKKLVNQYTFLTTVLHQALEFFKKSEYHRFDALVGENACQIRAFAFPIIAMRKHINVHCKLEEILKIKRKLQQKYLEKTIDLASLKESSMNDFLHAEGLNISMTFEEMFIFCSFFLSECKAKRPEGIICLVIRDKSDPKNLHRFGTVTSSFIEKVEKGMRCVLSRMSVELVRSLATELADSQLESMLSDNVLYIHNSRFCLPMYWTYKVLLKIGSRIGIPILLKTTHAIYEGGELKLVDQDLSWFLSKTKKSYDYAYFSSFDAPLSPVCIFKGLSIQENAKSFDKHEWKKKLLSFSLREIILSGAACHRQYPNDNIEPKITDSDYIAHKRSAKENGFSIDNPKLFFIQHVYPSSSVSL